MFRGMVKIYVKKDVCHFELVIEVLIIYIQIPTTLELTKAQQSSTSKATTSKLKDRFPLRLFNRSPCANFHEGI
jgi:hypothetical protein